MSGSITTQELDFFLTQLAQANATLTAAQTAFTTAQNDRATAQTALQDVKANALTAFSAMFTGQQPTATDLQNYLSQVSTAQANLQIAQDQFVVAQQALDNARLGFNTLVANAKAAFSEIFDP